MIMELIKEIMDLVFVIAMLYFFVSQVNTNHKLAKRIEKLEGE